MIYDVKTSSAQYTQLVDFSRLPVRVHQIRGISLAGDRLYALAPCVMLIFRISSGRKGPVFVLENTICLPEWVVGSNEQGNLHAVYASKEQERVCISFNAQSAIDTFDLEGKFLQRRYLWDIAQEVFPLPRGSVDKDFTFGVVRHIFQSQHRELMMTTALMNGTKDSAVISYGAGERILGIESQPVHGGLVYRETLYLCAIQRGEVQGFAWPQGQERPTAESRARLSPRIIDSKWKGSEQKTRGLAINNGRLLCGVFYLGSPKPRQIPPRIVEFDLQTGEQIREHWLPSFQELEEPHIYALLSVPKELEEGLALEGEPVFYKGQTRISPNWIVRNLRGEKSKEGSGRDTSKATESKGDRNQSFRPIERGSETGLENESEIKLQPKVFCWNVGTAPDAENKTGPSTRNVHRPSLNVPGLSIPVYQSRPTVIFEEVGLCFERAARKLLSFNRNLRNKKSFWALRDVSFTVCEGETLGVIGRNGSGKSTLSMICSGVLVPDKGKVTVHGRAQLLALGVGFKNELSGRENVFVSGSLLGLSKNKIKTRMDEIEEFAELGEFMDEPVRTYSSGMRSRLGFAVATAVKPDILILDEIMATGDKAFQEKAMQRMREMRGLARCVILVSHNPGQLRKLSTRVLWLEKGRMFMLGEPKEVLNAYDNFCQSPAKWLKNHPELANKIGSGEIGDD
jgi:ABC-type polysaccharide/polyol phosphate transport system ATPase subunit